MSNRVAILDLGTNTFHLLIAELNGDSFSVKYKEKAAVKIGKGGINQGLITTEAQERAYATLRYFKNIIDEYGVTHIAAVATSAFRNTQNGQLIADKIYREIGIPIKIIDGLQEAEYIYYGVQLALNIGSDPSLIMDIGGGSVEFIIGNQDKIFWKQSFEVGGQRLYEKFHRHDPIKVDELENCEAHLGKKLKDLHEAINQFRPTSFIGSSGTFDTLNEIYLRETDSYRDEEMKEGTVPVQSFLSTFKKVSSKNRKERMNIPGMVEMRVDMITVACQLIKHVLDIIKVDEIRVSSYALKEGVLNKEIRQRSRNVFV